MQTIVLERKFNYGTYRYFPKCKNSKLFCELLGKKSLSDEQQKIITKLGYSIKGGSNTNLLENLREKFKNGNY